MKLLCEDDWSSIKDHEDYIVSSSGRILSYKKGTWNELKPQKDTDGYLQVVLSENGKRNYKFVHRLVAESFLYRPKGCTEVNHIDGCKANNDISNLEWTTRKDNMLHAHDMNLVQTRKPILVTNIKTGKTRIFRGQREASRILNINQGNMNHALKGRNRSYKGYRFEYLNKEVS